MKKLAIVIVNYNVCHFLEQCIISVKKAIQGLDVDVYVVDNNSADKSVDVIKDKFPEVILIANKENVGFSKANNQAIRMASAEYVLLLNPDTVVEEYTIKASLSFMDEHPDCGGLGIKMLDGNGRFLPESKRSLPTPWVAFFKIFGFSTLFPKSRLFGRYHLGFLDHEQTHKVEVLSGAYMMLRKSVLDKIGLLDEDYFMYGEDIDMSYRITQAGYENYYYPGARIIHYKGESTKKGSLNYVFVFYKAMILFARKHFKSSHAGVFAFLINMAIILKAAIEMGKNIVKRLFYPLLDFSLILLGLEFFRSYWEQNHKAIPVPFPPEFSYIVLPIYTAVWLVCIYFSGGYDKPTSMAKVFRGAAVGMLIIAAASNFLDAFRYSKAIIIIGAVWSSIAFIVVRWVWHYIKTGKISIEQNDDKRIILIGNETESLRVFQLLSALQKSKNVIGFVPVAPGICTHDMCLGHVERLNDIVNIYKVNEVIFCSKDIPVNEIIELMTATLRPGLEYKIVPDESNYVIGSKSKNSPGDIYTLDLELQITKSYNKRNKRVIDTALAGVMLLLWPILAVFYRKPINLLKNMLGVLAGWYTFVGLNYKGLVQGIKPGILNPSQAYAGVEMDEMTLKRVDLLYAKEYRAASDLAIIAKAWRRLDADMQLP